MRTFTLAAAAILVAASSASADSGIVAGNGLKSLGQALPNCVQVTFTGNPIAYGFSALAPDADLAKATLIWSERFGTTVLFRTDGPIISDCCVGSTCLTPMSNVR